MFEIKLGMNVYHKRLYDYHEQMKIVGIREFEVELEGDYSGGTNNVCQKDWLPIEGLSLYYGNIEPEKTKTIVISAFPATGKSYLFDRFQNSNITALDSDSSKFSWISEGVRNKDFPNNYISHIKENMGKVDYIFVSSHKEVRNALKSNNIPFWLVFPHEALIQEYITRYSNRGNDYKFIDFISKNWFSFLEDLKSEKCQTKIQLLPNQFLADIIVF